MYTVIRCSHEKYGAVISIDRDVNGSQLTPFRAVQCACKERRIWLESNTVKKVRILVDGQVMSPKQAEHWAHEEYKSLPKCTGCAKILNEDVHTHRFCPDLFCSQDCADKDYNEWLEKIKDEEEIDYL
jgi:endogenous inhibitor of DNA gyrase (YacG/DUF329 family)